MTYFEHCIKSVRFIIPIILVVMAINALILYHTASPNLFKLSYWLQYVKVILAVLMYRCLQYYYRSQAAYKKIAHYKKSKNTKKPERPH
jgi:hypothetical protein